MDVDRVSVTSLDARLEAFEQHLHENPDDLPALSAYGQAALLRGRLLDALKSYQRLAALQPETLDYQIALGKVYLDCGLLNEAYGVVRDVLARAPDNVEGHILLSRLARLNGALPADVSQTLRVNEQFLPAPDVLAAERTKVETELGQLDAEIQEHRRAVETSPGDPAAEFSLQMAQARRGRVEESLRQIEQWEMRNEDVARERRRAEEEAERARLAAEERARLEADLARQQAEEEERQRRLAEQAMARRGGKERQEAYERLADALSVHAGALLKTKGVSAAFIVARDGALVYKAQSQELDEEVVLNLGVAVLNLLAGSAAAQGRDAETGSWQLCVLEFAKGIAVLKRINRDYFLLVLGHKGANFGVLTWTLEKSRAQFEEALACAPPVPACAETES